MDFRAHETTRDNSSQVFNLWLMKEKEKKKTRVHDFDPQKSRQRALFMGLSGDAFEKCGARHLPAVPPGDQSYAEGETIGGQCGEVSGSLLF